MESFLHLVVELSRGIGVTLSIFVLTLIITIPLGFLGSQVSLKKNLFVKSIYNIYLVIMRGTPLILQILFLYFGLTLAGVNIGRFESAMISFVLNYTAYFSEIFRGGIQSIAKGQFEAASVLGLTKSQTMRKIVVPQVFKIVMPSLGNEVVTLVKDTALVNIISVADLLKVANSAAMREAAIMPFIVATIFYLVINSVVSLGLKGVEKRLDYYRI